LSRSRRTSELDALGVALRPPAEQDLKAVFSIHGDERTNRHNPAGPLSDLEDARTLLAGWIEDWRSRGVGYWVLEAAADARVLGFAGVRIIRADVELLNLYYRLSPDAWGRGIARAVARHAVGHAHRGWPQLPVIARMQPGHVASERTALSAGLQPAGHDPWGRIVLADRAITPVTLRSLPAAGSPAP
jgi:[ribosomal protein S5]-alanine N-acetyltransferase